MSAKPVTLFEWAASTLFLLEPTAGQKAAGFQPGMQFPAHWINFLLNNIEDWVAYVNNPDSVTLGADRLSTEANAVGPRITIAPASEATAQYVCLGAFGDARIWVGSSTRLAIVITYNATRTTDNSDKWQKITNSQPATALYVTRTGIRVASMPLAQNTVWTDAFVEGEGTASGWGTRSFWGADTESETNAESDAADHFLQAPNTAGTERKCLLHINRTSGVGDLRIYYTVTSSNTDSNALEIVFNAAWSNSSDLWTPDLNSTCKKLMISKLGIELKHKNTGSATFNDASWDRNQLDWQWATTTTAGALDENILDFSNGRFSFLNTGSAQQNDSNPPFDTSQSNVVGPRNVAKVLASFACSGADGNETPFSGFNLSSAADAISHTADVITVKFGTAFQSTNYEAVAQCHFDSTTAYYTPQIITKSTGQLTMRIFKTTTGGATSVVDLNTETIGIDLTIFGRQDT